MRETTEEIVALQQLLERSHAGASRHLRGIINDERTLTARNIVDLMTGMRVLSVATVTAQGEPRISAMDGHFLHGTWTFSTDATAVKAKHLAARPAVSVAHVDGEELALFAHGQAERLGAGHPALDEVIEHWTTHYGQSPLEWAEDIAMYRLVPTWMVGYAFSRSELIARRGLSED